MTARTAMERSAPRRTRSARRAWAGSVILATVALVAGCTSGSSPGGAPVPGNDPTVEDAQAGGPSSAPPEGCILLVRGLAAPPAGQSGGTYTGAFLVLRVEDGQVSGMGGDFRSEGYDVRGQFASTGPDLQMNSPTDPTDWQPFAFDWDSEAETFEGWDRVRPAEMLEYSGGAVPTAESGCRDDTST